MRIGIPRGLHYSRHGTAWEELARSLGHEPVTSPATNRAILDSGCRLAVDETCLSVKVYLGHVAWLAERCDAVLVPRFVSERKGERECVKLWGIYDIARNALPQARIVGYSVDASGVTQARRGAIGGMFDLAVELGATRAEARRAVTRAVIAERRDTRRVASIAPPSETAASSSGPTVLVIGHGYNLHDELIGAPIIRTLRELGCRVVTSEDVPTPVARRLARRASPSLEWTNNLQLLGAAEHGRGRVDGFIFLVTFPCGPDSLVTELATRRLCGLPAITLVLDEHAGEGGLRTRLESFVDILAMQKAASA